MSGSSLIGITYSNKEALKRIKDERELKIYGL
jgi:hypothetical protein